MRQEVEIKGLFLSPFPPHLPHSPLLYPPNLKIYKIFADRENISGNLQILVKLQIQIQ
jgi:hypothetical protein